MSSPDLSSHAEEEGEDSAQPSSSDMSESSEEASSDSESQQSPEQVSNDDGSADSDLVLPYARRPVESDSSEFMPSDDEAAIGIHREGEDEGDGTGPRKPSPQGKQQPHSRKRPARPSLDLDLGADDRPLKRFKGALNRDYVTLLNVEIEDAATRYASSDWPELHSSQIGLTVWTPPEKDIFFESLSRLGRDDIQGIARSVKTKGDLEIRQYLKLLDDALTNRKKEPERRHLQIADYPAATELSAACCMALDEAADAVSLKQEEYEDSQEQLRWGEDWLVSAENYARIEASAAGAPPPSFEFLFKMENWLKLPELFFMNTPSEDGNWQAVGELPRIRATTLEDFHSLAVSMTKRLVSATLYMSMSRIRSQRVPRPETRNLVRKRDVAAAVASLSLQADSTRFWVELARRLQLNVYEDPPERGGEYIAEPMAYAEVEKELSNRIDGYEPTAEPSESMESTSDDEDEMEDSASSDSSLHLRGAVKREPVDAEDEYMGPEKAKSRSDVAAKREAIEVTHYSALGFRDIARARELVLSQVKARQREDEYADSVDRLADYKEEKRLWSLLGREPPSDLVKPEEGMARPINFHTSLDSLHPVGEDWRARLNYVSQWDLDVESPGTGQTVLGTANSNEREIPSIPGRRVVPVEKGVGNQMDGASAGDVGASDDGSTVDDSYSDSGAEMHAEEDPFLN